MFELGRLGSAIQPLVEQTIYEASIGAWVGGAAEAMGQVSILPTNQPVLPVAPPIQPPITPSELFAPDGGEPILQFPALEHAVEALQEREIVDPATFYRASAGARQNAFTISGDLTEGSLVKIHDILVEGLQATTSRQAFLERVGQELESLPISEAHLEQVYRNAVNESFSQGMETVLDNPMVDDGFPYRLYAAIHDDRARPNHLALEEMGIGGTAVYYKDDPTWLTFRPPFEWNCRCGWSPLGIESAAAMGVREAQEWLGTGIEPAHPPVPRPSVSPPASWQRATVGV